MNMKENLPRATFPGARQRLIVVLGSLGDMQGASNRTHCVTLSYPPIFQVYTREGQQFSFSESQVHYPQEKGSDLSTLGQVLISGPIE